MKKLSLISLAWATALAISPVTLAAQEWDFSYSDSSGVTATGNLNGILVSAGEYLITSGTIVLTGASACNNCGALSGPLDGSGVLVANPVYAFEVGGGTTLNGLDDMLFPGQDPVLDTTGGLAFLMSDGLGVGIGGNGADSYWIFGGNWTLNDNGSFALTAVPESSSFVLTTAPEGGSYPLYALLACGSCFGAMILNSRDRLRKHETA